MVGASHHEFRVLHRPDGIPIRLLLQQLGTDWRPTGNTLAVPAGASSGRKLRLRGQGCQTTPAGDLYAVLLIQPPPTDELTEADLETLARLGRATPVRTGPHWPASARSDSN